MTKPLIGITGARRAGATISDYVPAFHRSHVDTYIAHYAQAMHAAGAVTVHLPLDVNPADIIEHLDGLLLTGGQDVTPDLVSSAASPLPVRDEFEMGIVDAVISRKLPILGVCRGPQLLNIAAGGTVHPDLPDHHVVDGTPHDTIHTVSTIAGSLMRRMYGPELAVNSMHHQAVDRCGDGYIATAYAPDGITEAIVHTELPIIGVQWHPEHMNTAYSDPLFAWMTQQAAAIMY